MKRTLLVLVAAVAAGALFIARSLPDRPAQLGAAADAAPPVRGAIHIHSRRSDGTGTVDEIAAAASRAGLRFVILTDHGDGTRDPDPPAYRNGVLCIDAVEISAEGGHVVALGMTRSPYPLAGEARDVIEDVQRLGGMSIAAHPVSPKPDLRWVEWTAPFDGIEWLNGDSEWRDEPPASLVRALLTYPFRRAETLAAVLDRPAAIFARWDVLTGRRRVVALAAADAHSRVSLRGSGNEYDATGVLHLPAYEQIFRAFSVTVTGATLTGDAVADARVVLDGIRQGHVYSSVDALARPVGISFVAEAERLHVEGGDVVPIAPRDVTLTVRTNAPPGAQIVLLKNGEPAASQEGGTLTHTVRGSERAAYRVEVRLPGAPGEPAVPWVVTNPIYVGDPADQRVPPRPAPNEIHARYSDGLATDWTVETSPRSQAALDHVEARGGTELSVRWALGGTRSEAPYAALVMPAGPGFGGYDRIIFTARASAPTRLSVQLRIPEGEQGERWHRSVFLDDTPRDITIFFDEMVPRGVTSQRRPVLSNVRDVLFVIDTVNSKPGMSGQFWIDDVKYGR